MSDDEDLPQLSAETFAVLQEFYKEQEDKEAREIESGLIDADGLFEEDWQLSQFWYNEETIDNLVKIALKSISEDGKIALISCPTLYKKMKELSPEKSEVHIYEYDERFTSFGCDFMYYDYKSPLDVPKEKNNFYDLVIADPPFLSDECLTKTAVTMKFLGKEKFILCTGAIMESLAGRLLDLRKANFQPRHKNNLANEFSCFTNFDIDSLL